MKHFQNKITKIEKWAFLTSKAANVYIQYIFMPSANQEDFDRFVREIDDRQLKEMLITTFNMTRLTMENLDILGNLAKNRN